MKYIIDMIDDMRENIQNAKDYALLVMLLKEDSQKNFQNAGEKIITSLHVDHEAKQLQLGFSDRSVISKDLLELLDSLEMQAMMYEIVVKISDEYPLMNVMGFGENHKDKKYIVFVTT